MAQLIADRRDVDFVLHEQMEAAKLSKHKKFREFNRKVIDMTVTEARNLAIKEILPTLQLGDREGCRFEKGKVITPECFKKIYRLFTEGEWVATTEDPKFGGQGMPSIVSLAVGEYFAGANSAFMLYPGLTASAGRLVKTLGTKKQKELFLEKLNSGEWCGTMLLTEPEAGSDVGALTTTAVKNKDDTYCITGNKIFISGGEHDLTENIIHPVLARIEGAPTGTKGISLFLVPKIWVNDDGGLGEPNDVVCTGIEEKMGIHGNSTCSLALGGKGKCRGFLIGEENKGMRAMFMMMNEARLFVGLQGFAIATTAYMYALKYARERIQGKNLLKSFDKDAPSVPIIQHPDVRRQLLTMKAYVEGMRSLLYYVGLCEDKIKIAKKSSEKEKYQGIIDVLIPIAKGYITDKAFEVTSHAVQVYGGYGYIREYPVEQLMRDCRITMIYEGTNGIQAMDLLGRKLGLNEGKPIMDLFGEMQAAIKQAKAVNEVKDLAIETERIVNKLAETAMHIGALAQEDPMNAFAFAHPFMEVAGDVTLAWMHLWRARVAAEKLAGKPKRKDIDFYEGQIKTAEFFINTILPVTFGKMKAILKSNKAAIEISEKSFGG